MIFREGLNKKGFIFFLFIVIILLLWLSWSIAGQNKVSFSNQVKPQYQVKLIYQNSQYILSRDGDNLRIVKDGVETMLSAPLRKEQLNFDYTNWLLFDPYILMNYFEQNNNEIVQLSSQEYQLISNRQIFILKMNDLGWPEQLVVKSMSKEVINTIKFEYLSNLTEQKE